MSNKSRYDEQVIIDALRVIQDVCKESEGNCEYCPFWIDECGISANEPMQWKIQQAYQFRALVN